MSEVRVFEILDENRLEELAMIPAKSEKELQSLFETNSEKILGVSFLATEYNTKTEGRIDTLGIDENNCPVIIEYKRDRDMNVLGQGTRYARWLDYHEAEFENLVQIETEVSPSDILWNGSRLVCVANDFLKDDLALVNEIPRQIDLIEYSMSVCGRLLVLVRKTDVEKKAQSYSSRHRGNKSQFEIGLATITPELDQIRLDLDEFIRGLDSSVEYKELKTYCAYKLTKNFACVEIRNPKKLLVFLKLKQEERKTAPKGWWRDMTNRGHQGTGNDEFKIETREDFERLKPYIKMSLKNV